MARTEYHRVFLLSPANSSGERMRMLLRPAAEFDLARRLRAGGATLGEAFQFTSGLYFRGKLLYARTFARAPEGVPGVLVIAPGAGLLPADAAIVLLGSIASAKYVEPLLAVLGERLLFPPSFVGRGDMSRGGLLL